MQKEKGFTVIELIVVIVAIALLAAIVLFGVVKYIQKSKIAAIKANVSELSSAATMLFASSGSFDGFCTSAAVSNAQAAIDKVGICPGCYTCNTEPYSGNSTMWCFCARENDIYAATPQTFCVDSSGYKKETAGYCVDRCIGGDGGGLCTDQ